MPTILSQIAFKRQHRHGNLVGTTNPQFVSPLANNIVMQEIIVKTTPLHQRGTDISEVRRFGQKPKPQGGKTDMGAFESNINLNEIISKATGNWETTTTWNLERSPINRQSNH
ncbi:MAG: hypothetical protein U5N85_01255 [Arcicella sp.]|nr:hypothetical protein [Arcicella sp.]